jgi:hypothetical protein
VGGFDRVSKRRQTLLRCNRASCDPKIMHKGGHDLMDNDLMVTVLTARGGITQRAVADT